MNRKDIPSQVRRMVIKVGSALLTDEGRGLDKDAILDWVEQMAQLKAQGIEVILVSSGAVAEGMARLGWSRRPAELSLLQAAAAVGQMGLVQTWEAAFQQYDHHTAQVLVTHDDIADRERYLIARNVLCSLIDLDVVAVVNENDSIGADEIKLGDNDTLAAMVANLVDADLLVILTDQLGLFDSDPRGNPDAKLISEANVSDDSLDSKAGDSKGHLGRGGMQTKLFAARSAARSGTSTIIASGREPNVLLQIMAGGMVGTLLKTDQKPLDARKQWMADQLHSAGSVVLSDDAVQELVSSATHVLPEGITATEGQFESGDLIACEDTSGNVVARGLCNHSVDEVEETMGKTIEELAQDDNDIERSDVVFINKDDIVLL